MQVESGKTYRMRNGGIAIVECEHADEPIYPLSGKCFDKNGNYDRLAFWMLSGRYMAAQTSEFDITEELKRDN